MSDYRPTRAGTRVAVTLVHVLLCAPAHLAFVAEVTPREFAAWEHEGADVVAILATLGVPTLVVPTAA